MDRRALAVTLAVLFLAPGCAGTDVEEDREEVELEEWNSYYVDSMDDLPTCDSSTLGRLYYVSSVSLFYACTQDSGWLYVDLTGPQGPPGEVGTTGPQGETGESGPKGDSGENGTDGADGQDGAPGQDGSDGQDGADGQDGTDGTVILPDCELAPWGYCVGANLNGMDLSGLDLTGINLRGASIQYADLSGATLDYAVMSHTSMLNSNLEGAGMNYTDYRYANLQGAVLVNSSLVRADLSDTLMWTTNLTGVDANWANLEDIHMSQVVAIGASFAHTNFQRSLIFGDFREAYFWNADFTQSSIGGDFQNSTLHGVFREATCGYWVGYCNFTNSLLRGDYTGFVFHNTDLTDAELHHGMDLTFADLQNAIVTNETLFDWMNIWHYTTWIDGSICNENPVNWGASPFTRTCDADGNAIDI